MRMGNVCRCASAQQFNWTNIILMSLSFFLKVIFRKMADQTRNDMIFISVWLRAGCCKCGILTLTQQKVLVACVWFYTPNSGKQQLRVKNNNKTKPQQQTPKKTKKNPKQPNTTKTWTKPNKKTHSTQSTRVIYLFFFFWGNYIFWHQACSGSGYLCFLWLQTARACRAFP